jgi:integrase
LVLEVSGKDFHPHLIRSIVAFHVVNELGGAGIGLAANLLGDTVKVVMDAYYRPNTDDAMKDYIDMCFKNKGKG